MKNCPHRRTILTRTMWRQCSQYAEEIRDLNWSKFFMLEIGSNSSTSFFLPRFQSLGCEIRLELWIAFVERSVKLCVLRIEITILFYSFFLRVPIFFLRFIRFVVPEREKKLNNFSLKSTDLIVTYNFSICNSWWLILYWQVIFFSITFTFFLWL